MTSFWSLIHLIGALFALIPHVECSPVTHILEKRSPRSIIKDTPLFQLTHPPEAEIEDYRATVLTPKTMTWSSSSVYWGSNDRSLATLGSGNFALSVQSNVGGWMCDVDSKLGNNVLTKDSPGYGPFWTEACQKDLIEKLKEWENVLQKAAQGQEKPIPLRIVGAQAFALSIKGAPIGPSYRPLIIPEMMGILEKSTSHPREVDIDQISLLGWPARKSPNSEFGFAIVQKDFSRSGGSSVIEIYSSGSGAKSPHLKNNPHYGYHAAITIEMTGGIEMQNCQAEDWDYWLFNVDQKSTTTFKEFLFDAALSLKPESKSGTS